MAFDYNFNNNNDYADEDADEKRKRLQEQGLPDNLQSAQTFPVAPQSNITAQPLAPVAPSAGIGNMNSAALAPNESNSATAIPSGPAVPQQPTTPSVAQSKLAQTVLPEQSLAPNESILAPHQQNPVQQPADEQTPLQQSQQKFQDIQDNTDELMKFIQGDHPEYLQDRARNKLRDKMNQAEEKTRAEKTWNDIQARGDTKQAAKAISGGLGDWIQYLGLHAIGFHNLADEAGDRLGINQKWTQGFYTDENGKQVPVDLHVGRDGRVIEGAVTNGGPKLTQDQLRSALMNKIEKQISKEVVGIDPATGKQIHVQTFSNGNIRKIDENNNEWTGDASKLMIKKDNTELENKALEAGKTEYARSKDELTKKANEFGAATPEFLRSKGLAPDQIEQTAITRAKSASDAFRNGYNQSPTGGNAAPGANSQVVAAPTPKTENQPRGIRNNNQGNIEDGAFARSQPGYKGSDGRFAIFDTPENGDAAQHALLSGPSYKNLTLAEGIKKYAPATDKNNPDAYAASIQKQTGIDVKNTKYTDLTPDQQQAVRVAMQTVENGQAPGSSSNQPTSKIDSWFKQRPDEKDKAFENRTKNLDRDMVEEEALQLVRGDKSPADIRGINATNLRELSTIRAQEMDPTWSPQLAENRKNALKRFTNPDSQISTKIKSHIVASNSIVTVENAFDALNNGDLQYWNMVKNKVAEITGNDKIIAAKTGQILLTPEMVRTMIPGGGALADRLEQLHLLNTNLSPAQQKQVFSMMKEFQGNALLGIRNDWTKAGLPKNDFKEKMLGDSVNAQDLLDYADKKVDEGRESKNSNSSTKLPEQTSISKSGKPIVMRNGRWEYQ